MRVGELYDGDGQKLARTAPLAVRSAGRPPEVRASAGLMTFEKDSRPRLPFSAIHVNAGVVHYTPVLPGTELRALSRGLGLSEDPLAAAEVSLPLGPMVRLGDLLRDRLFLYTEQSP